jgi:Fe-S oxidoreductase
METAIDKLANETKSDLCLECGKCAASCPFELWPMTIVEEALLGFDILKGEHIWSCFTCDVCTKACPSGVRFADFIEAVRLLAISRGITEYCVACERCGQYYLPIPIERHIEEILKQKGLPSQFPNLCPRCRKHVYADRMATPLRRKA